MNIERDRIMKLVPSLSRNQWLWLGGAAVLGVTEVVSAPIALVLGALPVLDQMAGGGSSTSARSSGGSTASNGRRRGTTRRRRSGAAGTPAANGTGTRAAAKRTSTRRGARGRTSAG